MKRTKKSFNNPTKTSEKLQKVLANAGLGSRREIENWIKEGRIEVNGRVAHIGLRVTGKEVIKIDGKRIHVSSVPEKLRLIMYHKPVGEICTRHDPKNRPTVFSALPKLEQGRWISVGRLDINTSGLILFTNNGEFANRLMHPSSKIEREYAVRVMGEIDENILKRLTHGIELEDGKARFEHIIESGGKGMNQWFHVVVVEGRNRLVRRLWESQNLKVSRLMRVRFGPIFLEKNLRPGEWAEVPDHLIKKLFFI